MKKTIPMLPSSSMQLLVAIWASIHQTGHSLETTGDKNAGEPRVYHARTSFDAASVSDDGQQPSVVGSHGIDYPMLLSENVSSFQLKSVDFASIRTKQGRSMLVTINHCCNLFHLTLRLLRNLAAISDRIEVVVIDDGSTDGSVERMRNAGITVLSTNPTAPSKPKGLSTGWNVAWDYFFDGPSYKTLFILNNDVFVVDGTFTEVHDAMQASTRAYVVGPTTTRSGLNKSPLYYNVDKQMLERNDFDVKGLPGTLLPLNAWVRTKRRELHREVGVTSSPEDPGSKATWRHKPAPGTVLQTTGQPERLTQVEWILGFFLAFKKDRRIEHPAFPGKLLDPMLINIHQEGDLFDRPINRPWVARDVVVYHQASATMRRDTIPVKQRDDLRLLHPGFHDIKVVDFSICRDEHAVRLCNYTTRTVGCLRNNWMWINCRKTCGICPLDTTSAESRCTDDHANCSALASLGKCTRSSKVPVAVERWMLSHCRLSCQMCPRDVTTHAVLQTPSQSSVSGTVPDSPVAAQPRIPSKVCRDHYVRCAFFAYNSAYNGGCKSADPKQNAFMATHCRESCGLCTAPGSSALQPITRGYGHAYAPN